MLVASCLDLGHGLLRSRNADGSLVWELKFHLQKILAGGNPRAHQTCALGVSSGVCLASLLSLVLITVE